MSPDLRACPSARQFSWSAHGTGSTYRLIARNTRALERVVDALHRRQRAYALLARHGFDPETCREVAAAFVAGSAAASDDDDPGPESD